jgi:hypothetical protein
MKKMFLLIMLIPGMICRGWGQTTIYSENFGTGTVFPPGWTATTGTNTWTPSTGSPSTGYLGASGGTNIVGTNGAALNTYYLTYSNNLSTIGYTGITVLWGARRTSTFSNAVTFEWSSDGTSWNPVTYTQVASNSTWALVNAGTAITLPAGAEGIANLRLRWGYTQITGSGTYRIDDLLVQGILFSPVATYTWQGPDAGDWSVAANWNPPRTTPAYNDILKFNDGTTKTVSNVIGQTIGQLSVSNLTTITLQASVPAVLTGSGGTGDDLAVSENSHLTVSGSEALTISLNAGSTGVINGGVTFSGGGHRLLAADPGSLVFMATGIFTAGAGFTGNPFGTSSLNSVIFQSGSSYISQSGSNPFGASAPNSVVEFQPGSLYIHQQSGSLSLSGRTYANFELNYPSTFSQSGSGALTMGNLTITSGTLNINLTGPASGTHSIQGNITIASGQALNFNPASPGTVTFNGTSGQLLSGDGTFTNSVHSTLTVNNAMGVTNALTSPVTLNGDLVISGGQMIINPSGSLIMNDSLTNNLSEGLLIRSDSTGTGSCIGNIINGSGTAKIERYIRGWTSSTDGWHFLSSPVFNQPIDPDFTDPVPSNYDFYEWDEPSMTWLNQKVTANNITSFSDGEGYLVAYANTSVKKFSGMLNNADLLLSNLSYTSSNPDFYGWHLLGNPFSCALQWNDGNWGLNHVAGIAKVLNSGGTYTDIGQVGIIPSMNGFLVQVTDTSNSITIPENSRIIDHGTAWYMANNADSNKLMLTVSSDADNTYAECVIRYDPASSLSYEKDRDSHFIAGIEGTPQFYSMIQNDTALSTNVLPQVPENKTIRLGFKKGISVNYTLTASGIETFSNDTTIVLEDLKTGQSQELTDDPVYLFSSGDSDDPERFLLHFGTTSGTGDKKKKEEVIIYSYGKLIYIKIHDNHCRNGKLMIYNLLGQIIMMKSLAEIDLNIVRFEGISGYYIAKVFSDVQVTTLKLFIRE